MLNIASITDIGLKRTENEDYLLYDEKLAQAVICDGMGGYQGGRLAASTIAETILTELSQNNIDNQAIYNAFYKAKIKLQEHIAINTNLRYMGAAVNYIQIKQAVCTIAQLGDIQAFLIRKSNIFPLLHLHNLDEDAKRFNKQLSIQEKSNALNILARCLCADLDMEIEFYKLNLQKQDRILIATDGLYKEAQTTKDFTNILNTKNKIELILEKLKTLALDLGGKDNISGIMIEYA